MPTGGLCCAKESWRSRSHSHAPPSTHRQIVLHKGALRSLLGLCDLSQLKALLSGHQEDTILL